MSEGRLCPRSEDKARSAILVVEDEVLVRMAVAECLRQAGYSVAEAANAHEAVEILRHSRDVKLIVSDVRMPGSMDGVELARLARSEYPDTKVVLVSGHLPAIDWVAHDGYFRKPYDFTRLIEHIRTLIE
jgi:two-component system, response regulator PdtaR